MAFAELKDFLDPDLHIPFRGKTYTIPAASFEDGLYLQEIFTIGVKAEKGTATDAESAKLNDDDEIRFYERSLTPGLFQQLKDDRVPFSVIKLMAGTAMMECVFGRPEAEAFWASEGKAQTPPVKEPQDRRQKTATQTRTAAATTTRKRGSRTGTSTPKGTAAGTPGGKS